jgi:hypothetical protein
MHGLFTEQTLRRQASRQRRSYRPQFHNGHRRAAKRAVFAAQLYCTGHIRSLVEAAENCGSTVNYVRAAITVLKAENAALLSRVLDGHESLLRAGQQARRVADLVAAYRSATDADRVAFAKTCGPEAILNVLAAAS